MRHRLKPLYYQGLMYYQSGERPELLIVSGLHGDEQSIIPCIKKALKTHQPKLRSYFYIPYASPEACVSKTRRNADGIDINRHFFENTTVNEVKRVQSLLAPFHFSCCVTFHEDPQESRFYLYDSGSFLHTTDLLSPLKKKFQQLGVSLLSGIDDAEDPLLGHTVEEGYHAVQPGKKTQDDGTLEAWVLNHLIAQYVLTPEVPGKVFKALKDKIVDVLFSHIIIPLCRCR